MHAEDTVGFGRRAWARIIDLVLTQVTALVGGVAAGITLAVLAGLGLVTRDWPSHLQHGFGFNFTVGMLSQLAGASVAAWLGGVSLGKAVLGLRVVSTDGSRAGLWNNLIRELAYLFDGLFFGLVGKSAMDGSQLRQRYGDRWARTTVVRAEALQAATAYSTGRVALALVAGLTLQAMSLAALTIVGAL